MPIPMPRSASKETAALVNQWYSTLTPKEKALHILASTALKKNLVTGADDADNGSYFPDKCHAFKAWLRSSSSSSSSKPTK
jgi:hypothetical protein